MTTTTENPTPSNAKVRERRRYEFILQAMTPIAHHQQNDGNIASFFRKPVRYMGGTADVPYITADTMRHLVREASTYALLDALGTLNEPNLNESQLRLLFSGGMLTGRGDSQAIRLDFYRELVDLVPALGLLGGCADSRMVPGKTNVEDATVICVEAMDYIPAWAIERGSERLGLGGALDSCTGYFDLVQRVRMDPTLDPAKVLMLSPGARAEHEKRLLKAESAHAKDDAVEKEKAKSSMMPFKYERLIQGTLFFWAIEATCHSQLELDTLDTMVWTAMANARVGGKKGTGHGLLKPIALQEVRNNRPFGPVRVSMKLLGDARTEVDVEDRPPPGLLFRAHVAERAERIKDFLAKVDA